MSFWFFILGGIYIGALAFATLGARKDNKSEEDFALAGSDLGVVLGCLTVAATLYSTFTLMGMPDFFRTHGVGAWIFIAVSDAIFAFVILWFGFYLRQKAQRHSFRGIAGLMSDCYKSKWAGYIYLVGVFIFLIPYVAIQLRGIAIFLNAAFPEFLPVWGWASLMVMVMLIYSELGGLKAIIYADAIQGVILLTVTLIIAFGCIQYFGGIGEMFAEVEKSNDALLSVPGPKGLFTTQFLLASLIAIIMVPVTQPQVTVRIAIMRDLGAMKRMAAMLGVFAIILLLAVIPIGMYGAVRYPDMSVANFLAQVLIHDQTPLVAAAIAVGLIAAAISTSDSQIFAFGNEFRSVLKADNDKSVQYMRYVIVVFALTALAVAIQATDQLVLLARVSFAGTSLLAPLVITGVMKETPPPKIIFFATVAGLGFFLLSLVGYAPSSIFGLRTDLALFIAIGLSAILASVLADRTANKKTATAA